ncbi:hypothetical protein [Haloarchaeobius sp. HME9146]|uniref:hypothetical protein n=1 Tax=Haloarchaeobius sp. HME9146 TaxID=2978732 RepID=UPI0021C1CA84|nr:hypothetical protein [Haloarchaeobius sp. HME9146]MCT9095405.1 hypothetical protein [Haloarchaeobius sp. HME9146]
MSGLGISGITLEYLSQETLAKTVGDLDDNIPYVELLAFNNPEATVEDTDAHGRAPVYRTIPRDKWEINQSALDGVSKIRNLLKAEFRGRKDLGVEIRSDGDSVANRIVVVSTQSTEGDRTRSDLSQVQSVIPDRVTGAVGEGHSVYSREFRVDFETVEVEPQAFYDSNYDGSIPGGCQIGIAVDLADYPATSTCGAELNRNGNQLMVTAGHVMEPAQGENKVLQPNEGDLIGDHGWHKNTDYFDAGYSFHEDGISAGTKLANDYGGRKSEPIDGIVTFLGVYNRMGDGKSLYVQGQRTGLHFVEPLSARFGPDDYDVQFVTSKPGTERGDSGAPHFLKQNGNVYIAGVHAGVKTSDRKGIATSAEYVEKEFEFKIPQQSRDTIS